LKFPCSRVGGPAKDEGPAVFVFEEGLEGLQPEVGVDRGGIEAVVVEDGLGISFSGVPDVPPLGVGDLEDPIGMEARVSFSISSPVGPSCS
jgi:hypothetical protein